MGCDIHMYVEKLNPKTKEWEFQEAPEIELYYYPDTMAAPAMGKCWYWGRNYSLFALLADVRNGYGFAGVDTGDRVEILDEPRGIPEDASPEYKRIAGPYSKCFEPCPQSDPASEWCTVEHGWGEDGHSHSWFTLRELVETPLYDQVQTKRGVVDVQGFLQWKEQGRPETWSGGVGGVGIEIVDPIEMQRRIDAGEAKAEDVWPQARSYCQVQWQNVLRDSLGPDWFAFLDRLKPLTLDEGSDVRAVFFFDN